MSHYKRGELDSVVHYCDAVQRLSTNPKRYELWPWCLREQAYGWEFPCASAKRVSNRRAMVTCLLCMGLRKQRP